MKLDILHSWMRPLWWTLCLLLTLAGPASLSAEDKKAEAGDWWDPAFTIRKKITLATNPEGADIAGEIGPAAVLVRLHDGSFQFAQAQEDASDLRFVAEDNKTVLPHRIEKYDGLLNEAYVWVALPEIKPDAQTTFWMYYGGGEGAEAGAADAGKDLYDADTVLVYHFSDGGSPATDATKYGNNAQDAGGSSEGALIGGGMRLVGQPVTIPATESLNWTAGGELTWSAWVKPAVMQANAIIFSRGEGGNVLAIGLDNGVPFVLASTAGGAQRSPAGAPLAEGTWAHLAVTAKAGQFTLYVNGESYATLAAELPALTTPLALGGNLSDPAVTGFSGELDELNISRVARSDGWVRLAAIGQGAEGAKLVNMGEDEMGGEGAAAHDDHSGYFVIIFKNLTIDGWIVIWLCAGLAALSWYVMVSKVFYVNQSAKGNRLFMRAWSEIASDLTALDHGDAESISTLGGRVRKKDRGAIAKSTIFRVYHIGSEEIKHRLTRKRRSGPILSTTSIEAIRASLDAGVVRETARLNSGIVLLTIAISGGPFLGLLGTVVGVMITFAAVAAAGDVNVNAIAPGIAAALLATVAGLAVAIPALFGYNYLLTQIKGVNNDMHVFIDEFITRMAEYYGDDHEDNVPPPVSELPSPNAVQASPVAEEKEKPRVQFSKVH